MFIATLNCVDAIERHHTCYNAGLDIVCAYGAGATAFSTLLTFKWCLIGEDVPC